MPLVKRDFYWFQTNSWFELNESLWSIFRHWTRHWSDNIKMFSVNYMWPGPCIWINVCCVLSASLTIDWNGRRVPFTFHPLHLPLFSTLFSFIILTSEMLVVFHHFYWCSIKVHLPPNCLFIQISGIWKKRKNGKRRISFLLLRGLAYVQCFDSISTTFLESLQLPTERVVMCRMKTVKKREKKTRRIWFEIIICYQNLWPAETVERACKRRIFIPYQKPFISLSNTFNSLLLLFPTENKCARTLFSVLSVVGCRYSRYNSYNCHDNNSHTKTKCAHLNNKNETSRICSFLPFRMGMSIAQANVNYLETLLLTTIPKEWEQINRQKEEKTDWTDVLCVYVSDNGKRIWCNRV